MSTLVLQKYLISVFVLRVHRYSIKWFRELHTISNVILREEAEEVLSKLRKVRRLRVLNKMNIIDVLALESLSNFIQKHPNRDKIKFNYVIRYNLGRIWKISNLLPRLTISYDLERP